LILWSAALSRRFRFSLWSAALCRRFCFSTTNIGKSPHSEGRDVFLRKDKKQKRRESAALQRMSGKRRVLECGAFPPLLFFSGPFKKKAAGKRRTPKGRPAVARSWLAQPLLGKSVSAARLISWRRYGSHAESPCKIDASNAVNLLYWQPSCNGS